MKGHALLKPADGEPWRCRCGREYDWARSPDYPGGIMWAEARGWHRQHLTAMFRVADFEMRRGR